MSYAHPEVLVDTEWVSNNPPSENRKLVEVDYDPVNGYQKGHTVKETSVDEKLNVKADKGMIHDMDGIGHWVPIRWYFSKDSFDLSQIMVYAEAMEKKYTELRELTCPDDDD